jgi:hypothetical protein
VIFQYFFTANHLPSDVQVCCQEKCMAVLHGSLFVAVVCATGHGAGTGYSGTPD